MYRIQGLEGAGRCAFCGKTTYERRIVLLETGRHHRCVHLTCQKCACEKLAWYQEEMIRKRRVRQKKYESKPAIRAKRLKLCSAWRRSKKGREWERDYIKRPDIKPKIRAKNRVQAAKRRADPVRWKAFQKKRAAYYQSLKKDPEKYAELKKRNAASMRRRRKRETGRVEEMDYSGRPFLPEEFDARAAQTAADSRGD